MTHSIPVFPRRSSYAGERASRPQRSGVSPDRDRRRARRPATAAGTAALLLLVVAVSALGHPGSAIVVDRGGVVFFVDTGSGIWRLDRNGSLTRIAGPAFHWMTIDEERRFAQTRWPSLPDAELRPAGGNPALLLSSDFPVAIGRDGAFYYPERKGDNRVEIVRLMPSGSRSVLVALPLPWLNGMAVGPDGSIYYTENTAVRRVTPQGRVITVAGGIRLALCARIPGIGPELGADLRGLAVTPNGTVYVAASGCGAVLKIDGRGQVTPIAQTASPWSPTSVAVSGDVLYILEYLHTASDDRRQWTPRIRKVLPNGRATIVAAIRR